MIYFDEPNSLIQMDFLRYYVHSYVVVFNCKLQENHEIETNF